MAESAMFTRSLALFFTLWATASNADLSHELKPMLGKPAPDDFESVVLPDGTGAPWGQGSVLEGKPLYAKHCVTCHGVDGTLPGNAIAGGRGTLATARPNKTVGSYWPFATTLFDYINRAMPYGNEKSLKTDEVYAVTAYVLYLNEIIAEDSTLTGENLARVQMPNRDGFVSSPDFQPLQSP